MNTHIMNAANMPRPGKYELVEISEAAFMSGVSQAVANGTAVSSIGYPQNIQYIRKKSGVNLPMSRNATKLQQGDLMLIMKLKYRVDGLPKGKDVSEEDFEYYQCTYQ